MKELKYKKSTQEEVKAACEKYYHLLLHSYRYEAGQCTTGKVFGVSMNQFAVFLQDLNLIDKVSFTLSDADRFFITVNSSTQIKNNPMVPKNSLIRFQFLEIMVRTAIAKFYPTPAKSEAEAVEHLFT